MGAIPTRRTCPECDTPTVAATTDHCELVCAECGLVVEDAPLDHGLEWRAYSHQEHREKSRVGVPTTRRYHDKGLTTTIDWRDEDANGRALSARRRERIGRLRQWHERIRTSDTGDRNLQFALGEIDRMASALGVPHSTREIASVIYRRALAADLIRGRSIEGVATAALYAACRQDGISRSLEEVSGVSRIERTPIGRTYRHLAEELALGLAPVDPTEYVPRFRSVLGLSEAVETTAAEIIEQTATKGLLSGKSPTGFAAGALYIASLLCEERIPQEEVADAAQVTSVTVRNHYQAQADALGLSTGDDLTRGRAVLFHRDGGKT